MNNVVNPYPAGTFAANGKDFALNAVYMENRLEFAMEGHRFFDLKRTSRTLTRGSTCGIPAQSPIDKCSLTPTSREWSFPITETLTNANPNLVQNPSWK